MSSIYPIPGGTVLGHVTEVCGNVRDNPSKIDIELQLVDFDGAPYGEAILCSFRFAENVLAMNSKLSGAYGVEEKEVNPLSRSGSVVFQLVCTQAAFFVICNKKLVHQYNHRIRTFDKILQLSVSGDLVVTNVKP